MVKSKAYALIKNHEVEYYVEDFARDIKEKDGVLIDLGTIHASAKGKVDNKKVYICNGDENIELFHRGFIAGFDDATKRFKE